MANSDKMWAGLTDGKTEAISDEFNSSIAFDSRMYKEDITGSIAHAEMLAKCGIISSADRDAITEGLAGILADIEAGSLEIDPSCEDVHMFVEKVLTERTGDPGKRLHTARSRNDQVALDLRMYLRSKVDEIAGSAKALVNALCDAAAKNIGVIMPGYTHLQRAQPVSFGHCMLAYCMMLLRDIDRLKDCKKRINVSPIGSCALAGTTYGTDRVFEAGLLGFEEVAMNSMDGVSDRDFAVELAADISILMMHLSRLAEEMIIWSTGEFGFVTLSDGFTTGSSIMPQKKNPDMAELVRGKTGRVYGNLMALLTLMKGLPLAYNKDMQEDKEAIFDSVDTVLKCLDIFTGMIGSMKVNANRMKQAAGAGFINATDLADYLVGKGMPFRTAYKTAGRIVALCTELGSDLSSLPLEAYKSVCPDIGDDVYEAVDLENCLAKRSSLGGPSPERCREQIAYVRGKIDA